MNQNPHQSVPIVILVRLNRKQRQEILSRGSLTLYSVGHTICRILYAQGINTVVGETLAVFSLLQVRKT